MTEKGAFLEDPRMRSVGSDGGIMGVYGSGRAMCIGHLVSLSVGTLALINPSLKIINDGRECRNRRW